MIRISPLPPPCQRVRDVKWEQLRLRLDHSVALGIDQAFDEGLTLDAKDVRLDQVGSVSGLTRLDIPEEELAKMRLEGAPHGS